MVKSLYKDLIYPVVVLTVICLTVTLLLAVTNYYTKDRIAANSMDKQALLSVLNLNIIDADVLKSDEGSYKIRDKNGYIQGFVFITEDKGYGGTIQIMTGISPQGAVKGVKILNSNETPGLGKKCEDDSFLKQYVNDSFIGSFEAAAGEPSVKDGQIQAVTGATISSKAVTRAVNKAIECYKKLSGGDAG